VRRADNLTTFKRRLSRNLGASTSWNPVGLSRPVMGLLYLLLLIHIELLWSSQSFKNRGVGVGVGSLKMEELESELLCINSQPWWKLDENCSEMSSVVSFGISSVESSCFATTALSLYLCTMYHQFWVTQKFSGSLKDICYFVRRWNGIGGWILPDSHTDFVYVISRTGWSPTEQLGLSPWSRQELFVCHHVQTSNGTHWLPWGLPSDVNLLKPSGNFTYDQV
jgi:hypothetical protein